MNAGFDVCDHRQFGALLGELAWPAASVGHRVVNGEAAWTRMLPRLGRTDRRTIIGRLRRVLLLATPAGRLRLLRWRNEEKPTSRLEGWLSEHVALYGDGGYLEPICQTLALVPAPVRATVVHDVAFVTVGRESTAWFGSNAFVDGEGRPLPRVIVLGPSADVATIAHEVAHAWHAPMASEGRPVAITVQGEADLRHLAARQGWARRMDSHEGRHERLANACAISWLAARP